MLDLLDPDYQPTAAADGHVGVEEGSDFGDEFSHNEDYNAGDDAPPAKNEEDGNVSQKKTTKKKSKKILPLKCIYRQFVSLSEDYSPSTPFINAGGLPLTKTQPKMRRPSS